MTKPLKQQGLTMVQTELPADSVIHIEREAAFKATSSTRFFVLVFPVAGIAMLFMSAGIFIDEGMAPSAASVFVFIVGLVFLVAGLYLLRQTFEPIVFSLRRGQFRRGWSDNGPVALSDIYGLQLLAFTASGDSVYTAYELNLLVRDGSRRHVVCHGKADSLLQDAQSLAQLLGKPVFNGIK